MSIYDSGRCENSSDEERRHEQERSATYADSWLKGAWNDVYGAFSPSTTVAGRDNCGALPDLNGRENDWRIDSSHLFNNQQGRPVKFTVEHLGAGGVRAVVSDVAVGPLRHDHFTSKFFGVQIDGIPSKANPGRPVFSSMQTLSWTRSDGQQRTIQLPTNAWQMKLEASP